MLMQPNLLSVAACLVVPLRLNKTAPLCCTCVFVSITHLCCSLLLQPNPQAQLEDGFKEQLDVEETCRGFLELAKSISRRIVDLIFADTGMAELLKKLCTHAEWLNGTTTATIIATINGRLVHHVQSVRDAGCCGSHWSVIHM